MILSFWVILIFLLWLSLVIAVRRSKSAFAAAAQQRMVSVLGCFIVFEAFLLEPWVNFDFISYFFRFPEALDGFLPDAAKGLARLLGYGGTSKLIGFLDFLFELKGWQLQFLPSVSNFVHLATLLPLGLALLASLYITFMVIRGKQLGVFGFGIFQVLIGIISLLLLTVALPELDLLGIKNNMKWELVAVALGARVARGAFLSQFGLIALIIGGWVEISSSTGKVGQSFDEERWNE